MTIDSDVEVGPDQIQHQLCSLLRLPFTSVNLHSCTTGPHTHGMGTVHPLQLWCALSARPAGGLLCCCSAHTACALTRWAAKQLAIQVHDHWPRTCTTAREVAWLACPIYLWPTYHMCTHHARIIELMSVADSPTAKAAMERAKKSTEGRIVIRRQSFGRTPLALSSLA